MNPTAQPSDHPDQTRPFAQATKSTLEVVAGILWRKKATGGEILFAERPVGKVYAGFLEFPGGKCEPNETREQALKRELKEELSIEATTLHFWRTTHFDYPHAWVNLHFFWVDAWQGQTIPQEGQNLFWQDWETPFSDRVLPATLPLESALRHDLILHQDQIPQSK